MSVRSMLRCFSSVRHKKKHARQARHGTAREVVKRDQANYINALAVSVLPFFEPAMPMTLGGLFVTLGGFWYDIG
jgi:hypothetical protein